MDQDQVLHLLRNGNRDAFKKLYTNLRQTTLGYVSNRGGDQVIVHDILQEGLYRFLQFIRKNENPVLRSTIEALAFGFIKKVWLEQNRSDYKTRAIDFDQMPMLLQVADENIIFTEEEEKLNFIMSLLEDLGENCKEVLIGFYVHENKLKELAAELSLSESYIKLKRFRCMRELKEKYRSTSQE